MSYFNPSDLDKFKEVGKFSEDLMDKFFEYYNSAVGEDGALSKREKSLIALAIAHNEQCPYCIDAFTTQCLESGADPEQMTEAVHVAASMSAGIKLIYAVQMQNNLRKKDAL